MCGLSVDSELFSLTESYPRTECVRRSSRFREDSFTIVVCVYVCIVIWNRPILTSNGVMSIAFYTFSKRLP